MLEIIIMAVVVIILIALVLLTVYLKRMERETLQEQSLEQQQMVRSSVPDELDTAQSTFDKIVQALQDGFQPKNVRNEDDGEAQLMHFLTVRFPNVVQSRGHSRQGRKIDLVLEGVYALELILVINEAKLQALMNEINDAKQDFSKMAVILIDIGEVPATTLQQFIQEYQQLGVKTIVKKV